MFVTFPLHQLFPSKLLIRRHFSTSEKTVESKGQTGKKGINSWSSLPPSSPQFERKRGVCVGGKIGQKSGIFYTRKNS